MEISIKTACHLGHYPFFNGTGESMVDLQIPTEFQGLWNTAVEAEDTFFAQHNVDSLNQALGIWQTIRQSVAFQTAPEVFRWHVFDKFGLVLFNRSRATSSRTDIDQAIATWEHILANISPQISSRRDVLRHLGIGCYARYMQAGSAADLDNAIAVFEQATSSSSNQASLDLDTLNRLGNALRDRYTLTGSLHDLNEAITCFRKTISRTPESSPHYAGYLLNLGIALRTRFEITGVVQDLNEALDRLQRAVELMSDDDAYRASSMNSLGNGFRERYQRTRDFDDLARAEHWYGKAVERAHDNRAEQAMYLSNMGIALVDKFLDHSDPEKRDQAVLDEAVRCHQQAVQQTPATDSQRSVRLAYRANALSERYKSKGSAEDIQKAIADWQHALESVSPTAPIRVTYLNNLGNGFYWRGDKTDNAFDLQAATEYYRQAVSEGMDTNRETALAAAQSWGQLAYRQQDWPAAVEAYRAAIQVLEKILASQQERSAKQSWLRDAQLLYPRAAYALARQGELQTAVTTLESGRARFLAEALLQNIVGDSHLSFEQICTILTRMIREGTESIGVYFIVSPVGSVAFVIHRNGVEPVWLDMTEPELNEVLVTWQGTKPTGYLPAQMGLLDSVEAEAALDAMLPVVGQRLIGPLVSALEHLWENSKSNERCLVLIPTGRLAQLPLHAAPYASDGGQCTLLDRFTIVYVPSARARDHSAQVLQQQPLEQPSVLAIGNPLPLPSGYVSLYFADIEQAVIAGRFGDHAITLLGEQATSAAVMDSLGKTTYLHCSSHGKFDPEKPLESGVILSHGEKLTLGYLLSISRLKRTRLAVLSACQTAISDFNQTPDEVIGLPLGFLQAGIPGVVGSLWSVDDLSTMLLMERFYQNLLADDGKAPQPPARALREAQLWLRDRTAADLRLAEQYERLYQASGRRDATAYASMSYYRANPEVTPFAHPYYWAGFTFSGA